MSVSLEQLTALIDWLEAHQEVALGRLTRTTEGRALSKRLWEECALILNSVSIECCSKSPDQWRLYYNEYKSKVLKKIKIEKAEIGATGGGSVKKVKLTPLQERLYTLFGRDVGEPLPGVRHNPLSHNQVLEAEEMEHAGLVEAAQIAWPELPELESQEPVPSTSRHQPDVPAVSSLHEEVADMSSRTSNQPRRQTPTAMQRRRRRRSLQINTEHEPTMREATERLGELERISADATREHAQATNRLAAAFESIAARMEGTIRLAAAIEAVAERLKDPIIVIITQNSDDAPSNT